MLTNDVVPAPIRAQEEFTTKKIAATDMLTWNRKGDVTIKLIDGLKKVLPARHDEPYFCIQVEPTEKEILAGLTEACTLKAGDKFYIQDEEDPSTFWLHQALV